MVSEVIFPRFWGVVCIEKCFRNFEIVIGSAVSEISQLARFYVILKNIIISSSTFFISGGYLRTVVLYTIYTV